MAKPKKDKQELKPSRSVLKLAWERFEDGDVVDARRLANAALHGQVGPDELESASLLARELSTPEAPVAETIEAVAKALIERTKPAPKSYLFALLALAVFALLVTLAVTRYMS